MGLGLLSKDGMRQDVRCEKEVREKLHEQRVAGDNAEPELGGTQRRLVCHMLGE